MGENLGFGVQSKDAFINCQLLSTDMGTCKYKLYCSVLYINEIAAVDVASLPYSFSVRLPVEANKSLSDKVIKIKREVVNLKKLTTTYGTVPALILSIALWCPCQLHRRFFVCLFGDLKTVRSEDNWQLASSNGQRFSAVIDICRVADFYQPTLGITSTSGMMHSVSNQLFETLSKHV